MSLDKTIEELKTQIAEEEKKEIEEIPEEVVEEEEPEEEEKPKEEPKEEKAEEPKKEPEEEKPDAAAFQRIRREAAAAKKRADDLEKENQALKSKPAEPEEEKEVASVSPELSEIVQDHRMRRAEQEFQSMESQFMGKNADYEAVSGEYALALAQSIKIQNPRLSNNEVAAETKRTILMKASKFVQEGFNPVEELYHEAKELGFDGKSMKKTEAREEPKEVEIKPDMKKVAANRAKSTGMTASSGKSEGIMTKAAAVELTAAEWAKLPVEEKRRLMYN